MWLEDKTIAIIGTKAYKLNWVIMFCHAEYPEDSDKQKTSRGKGYSWESFAPVYLILVWAHLFVIFLQGFFLYFFIFWPRILDLLFSYLKYLIYFKFFISDPWKWGATLIRFGLIIKVSPSVATDCSLPCLLMTLSFSSILRYSMYVCNMMSINGFDRLKSSQASIILM